MLREYLGLFFFVLTSLVSISFILYLFVFTYCFKVVFKIPICVNSFCGVLDYSGGLKISLVSS